MVVEPGPDGGGAPGVERAGDRLVVSAVLVDQADQLPGLQQRRRDAASRGRIRRAHGVADEDESGHRDLTVGVELAAVAVVQPPAGQDATPWMALPLTSSGPDVIRKSLESGKT